MRRASDGGPRRGLILAAPMACRHQGGRADTPRNVLPSRDATVDSILCKDSMP